MRYNEFVKQAYNFKALSHPDNLQANTIIGGLGGAGALGGGMYFLAKLLKLKSPWKWGVGGAIAGGIGGAAGGNMFTGRYVDMAGLNAALQERKDLSDADRSVIEKQLAQQLYNNTVEYRNMVQPLIKDKTVSLEKFKALRQEAYDRQQQADTKAKQWAAAQWAQEARDHRADQADIRANFNLNPDGTPMKGFWLPEKA